MQRYLDNTSQSHLICENPSYRKQIISLSIEGNSSEVYKDFVHKFYSYLPVDYMDQEREELFASIAKDAFDFAQKRSKAGAKIEFMKDGLEKYNGTILQIVTENKLFTVDAIKYVFKKHDVNCKIFLNPLMGVKRDNKGQIFKIAENHDTKDYIDESVIFIVLNPISEELQKILIKECQNSLEKVSLLDENYDSITKRMAGIIDNTSCKPENAKFLQWVMDKNFTFLASLDFDEKGAIENICGDKAIINHDITYLQDIIKKAIASDDEDLLLDKMSEISPVNSGRCIDYIIIKNNNKGTIFFGFYTTTLDTQSVQNIPLLSGKLNYVLERSGFKPSSYNYRKLLAIMESLPRNSLFQIHEEDLYCICLHILSAMLARTLKLFIQSDASGEFLDILIFLPIERLTPETHLAIVKYLTSKFDTKLVNDEITDVSNSFCYLHLTLEVLNSVGDFSLSEIEEALDSISREWDVSFIEALAALDKNLANFCNMNIFPKEYEYRFSPCEAAEDYVFLDKLTKKNKYLFNLQNHSENQYRIKIYSTEKVVLSDMLPLIENLGFKALSQQIYNISMHNNVRYLSEFILSTKMPITFPFKEIKKNVEEALHYMSVGVLENDPLCNLVVVSGLKWTEVKLLKAITAYMSQVSFAYNKEYVKLVLVKHNSFTNNLITLFESKFYPDPTQHINVVSIAKTLTAYLHDVTDPVEDKILRDIQIIIESITRTNCYQKDENGKNKSYLSFKVDSSKIIDMPKPVPFAEIFVYSNSFEAIHLRGGKVARGGLRWSDRKEDYRREVLGLMKAQMPKNTVIVPVGSKGGFVVKADALEYERDDYQKHVVECYQNFLRGMLDITDNLVGGEIVPPRDVVRYDEDDPYLVVAADKGTATFSDYANAVSEEYDFWLGDAFASGGSAGYDHKKMAITAKGAWISVKRHFAEMGVDVQKDPISVVGIGDMSGDVFGNGMLLSKAIKLVVAFNHRNIFIDPNPDPENSFAERKRLFELPGSKWSDYDASLISEGGGIYPRSSKKIVISDEAKILLGTNISEFTPEALINTILKAPVDLIWNGGIGTYVKSSTESHLDVGDKSNDSLRCDGSELRAKVIGEGGNLGFSQLGRIEYARNQGRVNADFIDNSAGVDCSDHEVNIKIALNTAVKSGKINHAQRDQLLNDMTNEVEKLVLVDNIKQTASLTLAQFSPAYNTGMFGNLISALEEDGLLNREVEFLPSDKEIVKMSKAGESLSRPELSVLLSYSKMSIYNQMIDSTIADDQGSEELLINYFPPMMRDKFREEIISHPLRKEIILTILTNKVINEIGSPVIEHIESDTGAKLCDIIRSYIIVNSIFNLDKLWKQTEKLSVSVSLESQIAISSEIIKVLRRGICWCVRNLPMPVEIATVIESYGESVRDLSLELKDFALGHSKEKIESRISSYEEAGIPGDLARSITSLDVGVSSLDILEVARITSTDPKKAAELYFKVADHFHIDWMRKSIESHMTSSYWNRMSIQAMKDDLYDKQRRILNKILESGGDMESWIEKNEGSISIFISFLDKVRNNEEVDLNMMILSNKQFEILLRRI